MNLPFRPLLFAAFVGLMPRSVLAQGETPARAPSEGSVTLTSRDAAKRAVSTSPRLEVSRAEIASRESAHRRASLGWYPRLTLTARYTRYSPYEQPTLGPFVGSPGAEEGPLPAGAPLVVVDGSFPAFLNNYLLQASLIVPVSDYVLRTSQETAAARRGEWAARELTRAEEQRVAREAALAYYALAGAELALEVAEATLANTETQLDAVRALFAAERAPRADVLSAEARRSSAERLVSDARAARIRCERDLALMLGLPPGTSIEPAEDIDAPLPAATPAPLEHLYEEAFRQRAEIQATEHAAERTRLERKATRRAGLPRIDLFGNAVYSNPNLRYLPPDDAWRGTWEVGAALTFSPNDLALSEERATALTVEERRLIAERAALEDAVYAEIHRALEATARADAAVEPARVGLDAAREADRARRAAYQAGKGTLVEAQAAESDLVLAQLAWHQALVGQRTAQVELAHALGRAP